MREVYAITDAADAGRCFYVIRAADAGKRVLHTQAGPISVEDTVGFVQPGDAGRRLYRVPRENGSGWFWQAESTAQRDKRIAGRPE